MYKSKLIPGLLLTTTLALGGCAADGSSLLTTGALADGETKVADKAERINPECMTLMGKIQELRQEGTPERVEKISAGKGSTVSIKRAALAKITELDKANAEFQMKCSKLSPSQVTVAAAQAPAAAVPPPTTTVTPAKPKAAVAPAQ